jgi:hypothetical protein
MKSGSAMTQAEIAGGTVTPLNELPSKGHRLYDFELSSALGKKIHLSDCRGRLNPCVDLCRRWHQNNQTAA